MKNPKNSLLVLIPAVLAGEDGLAAKCSLTQLASRELHPLRNLQTGQVLQQRRPSPLATITPIWVEDITAHPNPNSPYDP